MLQPTFRIGFSAFLMVCCTANAWSQPLHERIDRAIESGLDDYKKRAAPIASDAEFLRRVYLDLNGVIPTAAEAQAFFTDNAPDKRVRLVDQLLAGPQYARHMQHVFDVMLMERLPGKNVNATQWREYLRKSFADNKPWDVLVREILSADGLDPKKRGPAKFILDRNAEPNALTRDIGRLLLGMNFTCCQCHDHPVVESYKQHHYYGIYAFLNRTAVFKDKKLGLVLMEKAEGDATFQSVFDPKKITKTAGMRVPFGKLIKEPKFDKGKAYKVKPAKNVRHIPNYSRRTQLAPQIASPDNMPFKRNIVNRLWAMMMGRGIIDPVDFDHVDNPPSHPKLLDMLCAEFQAANFDIRNMLRELALSRTYQRSSAAPRVGDELPVDSFAVAKLKPLSPEQLAWSMMQAGGYLDLQRKALGAKATEPGVYARVAGSAAPVIALFAGEAGKPAGYEATIDQALFINNNRAIQGWLTSSRGQLIDRVRQQKDLNAAADDLFLSILTRMPTDEERKDVAGYLKSRSSNPSAAAQEIAWALLASAEFRFNH